MKAKLFSAFLVAAVCAVLLPVSVMSAELEGTVQGFYCVTQGTTCPVGKEDPMAAAERLFVLHVQGPNYYFVPNVKRTVMARHINQMVKIVGDLSETYNAIHAKEIYVKEDGKYRQVWSNDWQDEIFKDIEGYYPLSQSEGEGGL